MMRFPKRLFAVLGALALVAAAIFVIGQHMRRPTNRAVSRNPVVTTTPEALPTPSPNPVKRRSAAKPQLKDMVSAAALAMSNLSQAQLLPVAQMKQVIAATVVPSEQAKLEAAYRSTGRALAQFLGYADIDQTRAAAAYSVTTQKYRVSRYQPPNAVVWLYTVSHWITGQNLEYFIPSISVIQMRFVGGHWRFVKVSDPPASKRPVAVDNLSYDQTVRRFQPFLKGFKPYVGS
jgi:hypothetical protein